MSDYVSQGINISPASPSSYDAVEITYDGLLYQKGAAEIYAHVGFDEEWRDIRDHKMTYTGRGFEATILPPLDASSLQVCFRDSANNWDNNSGHNYTIDLASWPGESTSTFLSPETYYISE